MEFMRIMGFLLIIFKWFREKLNKIFLYGVNVRVKNQLEKKQKDKNNVKVIIKFNVL